MIRTYGLWLILAVLVVCPVRGATTWERPSDPAEAKARMQAELAEPFSYFSVPSDVLGFKDCPEGTQLTGASTFLTGFGELYLYVGRPPTPLHKRVRTLHKGYLPIVEYAFEHEGVRYAVEAFGAPLDLAPRNNLVNFIRITARNLNSAAAADVTIGTAFAKRLDDPSRCDRLGAPEWYRDKYLDPQAYDADAESVFRDGAMWRSDHLLFFQRPPADATCRTTTAADTGAPCVLAEFTVPAGAERSLEIVMPYVPVAARHGDVLRALRDADFDDYHARVAAFWDALLARGMLVQVPEDKVNHAMRASLIYDLIARDIEQDGRHFTQKVNEFNYDSFYSRDTAYFVRTYDVLGHHDIARETVERFLEYDDAGRVSRLVRCAPDDWGQSLWALGQHYRATGDVAFARKIYPAIPPHIEGFVEAVKSDPEGLWPVAGRYDNEMVNGHYTGHNFWALLGLREAIHLARAAGADKDAQRFKRMHDAYHQRVMQRVDEITAQTGGYIPPGLDHPEDGYDWANASGGVYPFGLFDPHDPKVTATVELIRENKYREGLMTWGPNAWVVRQRRLQGLDLGPGWLHHYETIYLLDTLVIRGDQRQVVEDFYAFLAHQSSTHAGFEHEIWQWGNRDPGRNYPPHGWCAARFNALLRNMLVREQDGDVHLASVLSPAWVRPGRTMRVDNAATYFGPLSYRIAARTDGADVVLDTQFRDPPKRLLLHTPWFVQVTQAEVDGATVTVDDGVVVLPTDARRVTLAWRWTQDPALSYAQAVRNYLEKYYLRPQGADYDFLFATPRPPHFAGAAPLFVESATVRLVPRFGDGQLHYTLDGSRPGPDAPVYRSPLTLDDTTTVRAVTIWEDGRRSVPARATYTRTTPRPALAAGGRAEKLRFEYYEGRWVFMPDFSALAPKTSGTIDTFDVNVLKEREDDYAIRYTGYVCVPATDVYAFATGSDDGSQLYIGNELVVDNDGEHAMREAAGLIALERGQHPITVTFFNRGGHEQLEVKWARPGQPLEPLPFTSLQAPVAKR